MPKVLILHTGGTLGMRGEPLQPDAFSTALVDKVPQLEELADLEVRIVFNLDSSDMGPRQWEHLADQIHEARAEFDGFVIVHGTDTMAYTASALSFALLGLQRPIILTGAQRPLAAHRTDARRNLVDAVELATRGFSGVGICFDGLLLQGVKATKSNVHDYRAFASPGVEPWARMGVDVAIDESLIGQRKAYRFRPRFRPAVVSIQVTPGMPPGPVLDHLRADQGVEGVVIGAYGLGTVPTEEADLATSTARLVERGVDVLVVTQSSGHIELEKYENSRALAKAGVIPGGSMTIEAGVTKLMHGLAHFPDRRERRAYLMADTAGERGGRGGSAH